MANTLITPIEITRAFGWEFLHASKIAKNLNYDTEENFTNKSYGGQPIGETLRIRDPWFTKTRIDTMAMDVKDITETYKTLTIDKTFGKDLAFTDKEMQLSITDLEPKIRKVARSLAVEIDAYCAAYMQKYIPNCEAYTNFALPDALNEAYMSALAKIRAAGAPEDDNINCFVSALAEAAIVPALAGQYNPSQTISEIFRKGQMGTAAGMDWFRVNVLPSITTGTSSNADTPVVGTFNSSAKTSLPYTSATTNGTWVAGQCITIAGLYDVDPVTKTVYPWLKQFVITTNNTAVSGAGILTVYPEINFDTTDPKQNCYVASGSIDGAAITLCALNGTTAINTSVSTTYQQLLLFHRDAFAFVSIPLEVPNGVNGYTFKHDNINIRYINDYDIINARRLHRIDVICGMTYLRPEWAAKIWHV